MPIIEMQQIHKTYCRGGLFAARDPFPVLNGIDLSIAKGECLGLLGRSGSGKSTLGRIALGLEPPDQGQVFFRGKPLGSLDGKARRDYRKNVQVVFQNSLGSVNPRFTAAQIISEPLKNFESLSAGQLKDKVDELLTLVGLTPDDADKLPHQFSGGELQRVCIARAVCLKPRLIVLDEAVSSLDMLIQARIIDLLIRLQNEMETAYLFISHDIRVLLKMAHRLMVMHEGRLVDEIVLDSQDAGGHPPRHPAFGQLMQAILPPLPEREFRRGE